MPLIIGESITRLRAAVTGDKDRYGNPVPGADTPLVIKRCAFAPAGSTVRYSARFTTVTVDTIYAPPGADVLAGDRVIARGIKRQVDGTPEVWVSPFDGKPRGVVISLKMTEG